MYSKAELFGMAAKQPKEVFLGNVTLSIPDDSDGCADLDDETARLSHLWDVSRMSVREMVVASGISQTAFAKGAGIPRRTEYRQRLGRGLVDRTVQDGVDDAPEYVRFLLAEHYGLI